MRPSRRMRRLGSWIAILAFLVAGFAPTISHALAAIDGSPWAELCSTGGTGPAPAGDPAAHPLEHCPACALHLDTLAVPPAPPALNAAPPAAAAQPAAFLHAPRTLHAWRQAQPRAPPIPA